MIAFPRLLPVLAALLLAQGTAGAENAPAPLLGEEERRSLGALFRRLETAFLNRDAAAFARLLSPRLSEEERRGFLRRIRREFAAVSYKEFRIDDEGLTVLDAPVTVGKTVIYRVLVPCRFRYVTNKPGLGSMVAVTDQAQRFCVENTGGEWYLSDSTLFDAVGVFNPAEQIGWFVFVLFVSAVVGLFWLSAVYHCYLRSRSPLRAFLLFLTTPVGAAVYYFRIALSGPGD